MIAGKPQAYNDFEYLRQNNISGERQKLITGIFDRRMRQLSKLQSKQQILSQCQKIFIQKVLDYMNQLDSADVKYLQMVQLYTQRLKDKEDIIDKLQKALSIIKSQLKGKVEELENCTKILNTFKLKINHLESQNEGLIAGQKKDELTLSENKILIKQLQQDNFMYKNRNALLSQEITYLNEQINTMMEKIKELGKKLQNEGIKSWNQNCGKAEQFELIKRRLSKQLSDKQREIFSLREKMQSVVFNHSVIVEALSTKITKEFSIHKTDSICIQGQKKIKYSRELNRSHHNHSPNSKQLSSRLKDLEFSPNLNNTNPKHSVEEVVKQQSGAFITIDNHVIPSMKMFSPVKRAIIQDKEQDDEDKTTWKSQLKKQFVNAISQLYKLSVDIKRLANERIGISQAKKKQIEQILENRPSREQDIEQIRSLIEQIQKLKVQQKESQQRAESAYEAMRMCKLELKRVIDNTPMEIFNSPIGKSMSKSHLIEDKKIDEPVLKRTNSLSRFRNNSNKTIKKSQKMDLSTRYDDDLVVSSCLENIIGQSHVNFNKYVKYSKTSPFNISKQEKRRYLKSAI